MDHAMLDKMKQTIAANDLFRRGEAVLVALSGGPDSVALLLALVELRETLYLRLSAVYINHRIRPRAALAEERFCQELCERYDVQLTIVRENIPALAEEQRTGIEETARDFRYGVFEAMAEEDEYDRVALGHQADDQAETVLFRVIRGTGRTGLAGIPIRRGRIVRPLLEITRAEVLEFLAERKQAYCTDRTNEDTTYKRNYLRNRLLPLIRKNLNPKVDAALRNLADNISDEEEFLESVVNRYVRRTLRRTRGGKIELDLSLFIGYDRWVRRRLLRYCLAEGSGGKAGPDKETISRLDDACLNGARALSLPGHRKAVRNGDTMVIVTTPVEAFKEELVPGRRLELTPLGIRLVARNRLRKPGPVQKVRRARRVAIDRDKVEPPLTVRNIKSGDRFQPLGMTGNKKIGDYLTDRRVAPVFRDEIPVVCDRQGIIWLVGYEISERVKIDATTRKVVTIDCTTRIGDEGETV